MTAAIILAAGASTRLGHPKQLVELAGETLLQRSIRTAAEASLSPILLVVSPSRPDLALHDKTPAHLMVDNPNASEGMASSIRAGIAVAQNHSLLGAVILTCDQPAVTPAHLRQLAFSPDQVTASRYAGRNGIPAYFPASAFALLLDLRGDKGARDLLTRVQAIDLLDGDLDVDTPAELARAREKFEPPPPCQFRS
jgi:molybdenum cofactor cytidylyltransferase